MTATKPPPNNKKKAKTSASKKKEERANFPATVVHQIAMEAHLFCSNPECCRFTSFSTESGKPKAIAEAAHINAASKGGPRPGTDPAVHTDEFLKSAANGIWLCVICHKKVDADPITFPETLLKTWKAGHTKAMQDLVGTHFDEVLFTQYVRSISHLHRRGFLVYIENRRVFFDRMDAEFPPQVWESLREIRTRINDTLPYMHVDKEAENSLRNMREKIHAFLTAHPGLDAMKCDGNDPAFVQFQHGLQQLRKDLLPQVITMAAQIKHRLSDALLDEHQRLMR